MLITQDIQDKVKSEMTKSQEALKKEFMGIRAGRANPQLLDRISFDYYGSQTSLKAAANISAPEPRVLQIIPYDVKAVKEICRAIQASDIGINPSTDGKVIRLVLPELTEERRKELTKLAHKIAEKYKVTIRNSRREAVDACKKMKKNGDITEDDQKKTEEAIQKLTDNAIKEIDKICEEKEKEIMDVR